MSRSERWAKRGALAFPRRQGRWAGEGIAAFAAAFILCLSSLPVSAADRYTPGQQAYMEGKGAYDATDYRAAAQKMREAIAEDAAEGLAKFQYKGLNREDYFPHLYLGLSLDKLGQSDEAYRELKESQRQGVIRERASMNRVLESAVRRIEAARQAQVPPTAVPVAPAVPTLVPTRPPPPPTPTPPPQVSQPTPAVVPPTAAPLAPTEVPAVVPTSPVARATAPPLGGDDDEGGLSPQVIAAVREGVRSYFKGDYAGAVRQLTQQVELVPLARLFLSYSLAASELLKPTRDPVVVERARKEYAAARKDGAPTKNEELISPAVRALLTGK